jgi:hypothetical protein
MEDSMAIATPMSTTTTLDADEEGEHMDQKEFRTREGGSEWEPTKILLEEDENSNKTNMASKSHLRLDYPSWLRPRSHSSATSPRNQQLNQLNYTTQTHSGKLSSLLPVPHRSD